jgi:hypothetical protein
MNEKQQQLFDEMADAVMAVLRKHKISFDRDMLTHLLPDVTELLPDEE